ncbi:Dabb family protein [Blastococcus tunisiensis]|uniref:Stress responsive A/B Barrel Domain n=1 Tax=Blastococcus tunisiensis TaxID=1798228 RepID=A0A1I2KMI3_9ACTN|nr:Dabb family protein [Blastococcus sp. DSM 46838]SFF68165.1 Stress responsive A/B Barrel Domain [Blastococcus sp. DSM 46838]
MLMHVVTFRWKPDVTPDQVAALRTTLGALPAQIPELVNYRHGPDLGVRDGNADYAVVATLRDMDALFTYLQHPDHVRAAAGPLAAMTQTRSSVQVDLG